MTQVTGQVDAPPPEHWREVVRRMRLTDTQLLHFKVSNEALVTYVMLTNVSGLCMAALAVMQSAINVPAEELATNVPPSALPCPPKQVHKSRTWAHTGGTHLPKASHRAHPRITPFFLLPLPTADLPVHTLLSNHCVNIGLQRHRVLPC
jgi:hypothetical protein